MENNKIQRKIPCIKCDQKLWDYITPYLDKWGYIKSDFYSGHGLDHNNILVLNAVGSDEKRKINIYNNYSESASKCDHRELIDNVEEFLERAAQLRGFTYKKENNMERIELKPGMIVKTKTQGNYMVMKLDFADGEKTILMGSNEYLTIASYDENLRLRDRFFRDAYDIVRVYDPEYRYGTGFKCIKDIPNDFKVIWERKVRVIEYTKEEIMRKFDIENGEYDYEIKIV